MNIAAWLERRARLSPERPALFAGREPFCDYRGFAAAAEALAAAWARSGIGPGDRVALVMKNVPDYLIAMQAVWYAGAVVVPINAKLHPKEVAWILEDSGSVLCVATGALARDLSGTSPVPVCVAGGADWGRMLDTDPRCGPAPRAPEDLAWLFYTSGTTGRPKGVMITHRMLMSLSLCYQWDCDRVTGQDAAIYAAPLSHGAGIYSMMHIRAGARHVLPPGGGFDPAEVLDLAEFFGDAHLFMAPTMVQRLTRYAAGAGREGAGLGTIVYAGGPMYDADIIAAVERFGPVFVQIYGQGECPMGITALSREDVSDRSHPRWRDRLGSVGCAQSAVEVAVLGEDGQPVASGVTGEIAVRGDTVMPGYWRNDAATAKALRDGWLWTGDLGAMDEDGYVTLKDRSRDLIISGGTNIYPREIEETLLAHPSVIEVAVVGAPDPEWGEAVVAFVVAEGALDPAALDAHCLERMARFKRPKRYVALDALPKNNYGKVLKSALREKLAASS